MSLKNSKRDATVPSQKMRPIDEAPACIRLAYGLSLEVAAARELPEKRPLVQALNRLAQAVQQNRSRLRVV